MHPIVKDFIETSDRLSLIFEKHYDKDQFLEAVFVRLFQNIYKDEIDPQLYLDLDLAILKGHPDPSLFLLFISSAINFTSSHHQLQRANVIESIGLSLSNENLHPLIQSNFNIARGNLKLSEGKSAECNLMITEAVALIDKKLPRYISLLGNFASLMATQGRLKELDKNDLELLNPPYKNASHEQSSIGTKFANALVTCNLKEGLDLLEEYTLKFKDVGEKFIQNRKDILNFLTGDFDGNKYEEYSLKNYAKACFCVLKGNFEEASIYSDNLKVNSLNKFSLPLEKYISLHITLCLKNTGKSKLILQEVQREYGEHYLDDLFLARIHLLEMNPERANAVFGQLINNINRYEAMGRLVFELQFAKEMKPSDFILLLNAMNRKNDIKELEIKIDQSIFLLPPEKGIKLLIGESAAISQVKKLVKKFAKLKEPVLVIGETGTGKELVSRAIHDEGPNPKEPFLAINCGALTDSLLQSELFGYEAGAFTGAQKERQGIFEAAGKGTVFLDEFGDISQKLQTSLLRVLESNEIRLIGGTKTKQIKCKIVIATNIDLHQAVKEKKFREDLYFRLARFDIKLPPLRERVGDISSLISHFLKGNQKLNENHKKISKELFDTLIKYHWPGNIRELKNEIERLKILHPDKELLNVEDFDFSRLQGGHLLKPIAEPKSIAKDLEQPINSLLKNDRTINERIMKIVQKTSSVEQRHEFLKELFQQYKKLTRSQIMEIADISPVTATKDLQVLCASGFIERKTPTKSVKSHYFIGINFLV